MIATVARPRASRPFASSRAPRGDRAEMLADPDPKIARPRQIYTGSEARDYLPMGKR